MGDMPRGVGRLLRILHFIVKDAKGFMKIFLIFLLLVFPVWGQDPKPPRRTELPTALDTDDVQALGPMLQDLARYCRHHDGVRLADGSPRTIPACAATPPFCNSFPCCLPVEREVVVHSYNFWAAPTEYDPDLPQTVVSGEDGLLVLGAVVDRRLTESDRLCIPTVMDTRQRAVVRRLLKPLFDSNRVWFIRRIPGTWQSSEDE